MSDAFEAMKRDFGHHTPLHTSCLVIYACTNENTRNEHVVVGEMDRNRTLSVHSMYLRPLEYKK